jgi:hypothetical protein
MSSLTNRQAYVPERPAAERISEVSVNGFRLRGGMEITLWPGAGRKQALRFRFDYATTDPGGHLVLEVYGPLGKRRPPSYRCVAPTEVKIVHRDRTK